MVVTDTAHHTHETARSEIEATKPCYGSARCGSQDKTQQRNVLQAKVCPHLSNMEVDRSVPLCSYRGMCKCHLGTFRVLHSSW